MKTLKADVAVVAAGPAGLAAAIADACSIYGDSYVFILPGNTMGFALNSGRIAGENAARFARSV